MVKSSVGVLEKLFEESAGQAPVRGGGEWLFPERTLSCQPEPIPASPLHKGVLCHPGPQPPPERENGKKELVFPSDRLPSSSPDHSCLAA